MLREGLLPRALTPLRSRDSDAERAGRAVAAMAGTAENHKTSDFDRNEVESLFTFFRTKDQETSLSIGWYQDLLPGGFKKLLIFKYIASQ